MRSATMSCVSSNLAAVEHPLKGLDQRVEGHLRQRRLALAPLLDEVDCGHSSQEHVAARNTSGGELLTRLLVLLVLEQPPDEGLARVDLLLVEVVVLLSRRRRREKHLALDVGERRRHDEVLGSKVELHQLHHREILQVFLGHERDRDVEDVQLVLLAEVQQQIERALELGQSHRPGCPPVPSASNVPPSAPSTRSATVTFKQTREL